MGRFLAADGGADDGRNATRNPRVHNTAASEDVAITFAGLLAADGRTGPQPRNAPRVTHMLPLPVSFHIGDDPPTGDVSLRPARPLPLTN